ncbi:hypothetical protein QUB63_12050 [Microcoleus sp. ARI1-B5]|uniref:hypothetical protein n=1 Tax=Microcoleus sp. ARI1-A4 TaxID=2818559 RepID=UPI002FD188C5
MIETKLRSSFFCLKVRSRATILHRCDRERPDYNPPSDLTLVPKALQLSESLPALILSVVE